MLPAGEGGATTFYERHCGRPTVLLLAGAAADCAPFIAAAGDAGLFAILGGDAAAGGDVTQAALAWTRDDGTLAALLGETPQPGEAPRALVLDAVLRLHARFEHADVAGVALALDELAPPRPGPPVVRTAPVLMIPDVLDAALRARLVAAHEAEHHASGMLRVVDGRPALVPDAAVKRRFDHSLRDPALVEAVLEALETRVLPELADAFHYPATSMEGFKIARYDAEAAGGGWFRLHRDNVTPDARHRRFALSVNLNDDYDGGALAFPEYGPERYRPPAGGAIAFSGALLHEATAVTAGRRYVLLTFLWGADAEPPRR